MDWIALTILALFGAAYGRLLKSTVNWVNIDGYQIPNDIWLLEIISAWLWLWAFLEMPSNEATIFSLLASVLIAVSWVDLKTFQIPLIFMIAGFVISAAGILFKLTTITDAFWGIIVGAFVATSNISSDISFDLSSMFGFVAIFLAAINIFGGFLVTQRMLQMYKKRKSKKIK